jgi:hypothetical protein
VGTDIKRNNTIHRKWGINLGWWNSEARDLWKLTFGIQSEDKMETWPQLELASKEYLARLKKKL